MKYQNPVLRGMYPDPSMCAGPDGKYYMVTSSFQYFPGVPLFESDDLINWKQIGHCLTRKSQLLLEKNNTCSGIYAPTIRFNNGRFYMVVTNVENIGNFYVYTDNIYGEWSEPIKVEQSGIDPSLFFDDDGKVYFISNGNDKDGRGYIQMSEIDIATGKKLSENEPLWYGTGGRYIEAPHLYKFGDYYYLLNAEGGTEYGHMVNYARSKNIRGPYEPCPANPILTNRNLGGYQLQGAGHGDIVQAKDGSWWFCHLAFRQLDNYMTYHHLGRETCMEPVFWKDDWFYIGTQNTKPEETVFGKQIASGFNEKTGFGTALLEVEAPDNHAFKPQNFSYVKTFQALSEKNDWCYICNPEKENFTFGEDSLVIKANNRSINTDKDSPSFVGVRQCEFEETVQINCEFKNSVPGSKAGITIYMDNWHHYDLYIEQVDEKYFAVCKFTIGPADCIKKSVEIGNNAAFKIVSKTRGYDFILCKDNQEEYLGYGDSRYLSSEVAGGFTGVFIGLFAENKATAKFTNLMIEHKN